MISYEEFGKLRLHQFLQGNDITNLDNFEFENNIWIGESLGFSEWLCLKSEPNTLRSIAIDFNEFPPLTAETIMEKINLPLHKTMKIREICKILGEPFETHSFVKDRTSYEFTYGTSEQFIISCTILKKGGLNYLVIRRQLSHDE